MATTSELKTIEHHIGGRRRAGGGTRRGAVWDPATGAPQAEVLLGRAADVDAAVQAAKAAFETWGKASLAQRARVMFAFRELRPRPRRRAGADRLLRARQGPRRRQGRGAPRPRGGRVRLRHPPAAEGRVLRRGLDRRRRPLLPPAARRLRRDHPVQLPGDGADVDAPGGDRGRQHLRPEALRARPLGLGPDRRALRRGRGLPAGVFNVVNGDKDAVDALLDHPDVAAVSFVGSTPIAKYVHERATAAGKRVQALGGAKNHAVVMPDADLDFAANHLTAAGFGSAGQRCMAISVAVAVGDAADALVERAGGEGARDPRRRRPRPDLGNGPGGDARRRASGSPATSARASRRARSRWSTAASWRSTATASSSARPSSTGSRRTCRSTPTRSSARSSALVRVDTLDDAIELINENSFANGTAIFTSQAVPRASSSARCEVGMIGVNVPIPVPMAYYSFGGWKDSLFGDHHIHGAEGVRFYTRGEGGHHPLARRRPGRAQPLVPDLGLDDFATSRVRAGARSLAPRGYEAMRSWRLGRAGARGKGRWRGQLAPEVRDAALSAAALAGCGRRREGGSAGRGARGRRGGVRGT